ncbi:MAG: DNA alkylation repair protein [Bacteroidota bacterium]
MAEPLKNMFSPDFYDKFADFAIPFIPAFDKARFIEQIFDAEWEARALKERSRHTSNVLTNFLPSDFAEAVKLLVPLSKGLEEEKISRYGFEFIFLPDYIEQNGLGDYEAAIFAMENITQLVSCEFAIRPFIIRYGRQIMDQMLAWSTHSNHHVRRFSSEGCRPRLPWGMALPDFKKNPKPILPILENLKNDDSEFVRKSVANNLNDISKDNPEIALATFTRWKGKTKNTDWIVKHGSRTLLKQGNPKALQLFGFGSTESLSVEDLKIEKSEIKIGEDLHFSFSLNNQSDKPQLVRIEYGIYFMKSNGSHSRKVFQISEKEYPAASSTKIKRKQSFRIITTRKYYSGLHKLAVIVNGVEMGMSEFYLP